MLNLLARLITPLQARLEVRLNTNLRSLAKYQSCRMYEMLKTGLYLHCQQISEENSLTVRGQDGRGHTDSARGNQGEEEARALVVLEVHIKGQGQ